MRRIFAYLARDSCPHKLAFEGQQLLRPRFRLGRESSKTRLRKAVVLMTDERSNSGRSFAMRFRVKPSENQIDLTPIPVCLLGHVHTDFHRSGVSKQINKALAQPTPRLELAHFIVPHVEMSLIRNSPEALASIWGSHPASDRRIISARFRKSRPT